MADRQRFQEAIHGTQDSESGRFRRVRSLQRNPLDPSCLFGQRRQRWLRLDESVKKNHGVNESDEDEGGRKVSKGDASDDDEEELDLSNVISDRTRRRSSQPVHYDFPEGSDDDDSE